MIDTSVNIMFNVDSNLTAFRKELVSAQQQAMYLEKQLAGKPGAVTHLQGIHREFVKAIAVGQQFQISTIDNIHATRQWGETLQKQKLSFRESVSAMRGYRNEMGMINRVARENMRMMQSFSLTTGPDAAGRFKSTVFTPHEEQIDSIEQKRAFLQQRLSTLNATIGNLSNSMINWGKNTQWAGRQMMVGMTIPIAMFGFAAASTFKKVDEELVRITKVYGDSLNGTVDKEAVRKNAMANAKIIAQEYGVAIEETLALTADMAAVGLTGENLEAGVAQTTRLAILGEVDRQDAMKTTLSLQTAFKQNNQELAESINFLNAAENATSTSLQDMTEAIPRAGTVVKGLGGSVEDLTLYITAMREGGIGAAEAANALKSGLASIITPSKEAGRYVKEMGVDIDKAIAIGGGDLTDVILEIKKQLDALSDLEKTQVMSKLFGKHQMGRMLALFNNINEKTSQTQKIFDLMGESAGNLGQVADQEIKAVTESTSGRFKRLWQSLRAEMAEVGEPFLQAANVILEKVVWVMKAFNGMSDFWKDAIKYATIFAGLVGPIVMIAGILGNFAGYLVKGIQTLFKGAAFVTGNRISPYKMYDPQTVAAEKLGVTLQTGMFDAAKATDSVTFAVQKLNQQLLNLMNQSMMGGMNLNQSIAWGSLQPSGAPRSMPFALETHDYNQWLKMGDPRIPMETALMGSKVDTREAMLQKMTMDSVMYEAQASGRLTPDVITKLQNRGKIDGTTSTGKKFTIDPSTGEKLLASIKGIDFGDVVRTLNTHLETILPGITQEFDRTMAAIRADVDSIRGSTSMSPAEKSAAMQRLIQDRSIVPSAMLGTALEGTGTGYRSSGWTHAALAGTSTMLPNYENDAVTAIPLEKAIRDGVEIEQGHTSPDQLNRDIVKAYSILSDEAATRVGELHTQAEDDLRKRNAAYSQIAQHADDFAKSNDDAQRAMIASQADAVIQGDKYLKSEMGRVHSAEEFQTKLDEFHKKTTAMSDHTTRLGTQLQDLHTLRTEYAEAELKAQQTSAQLAQQGTAVNNQILTRRQRMLSALNRIDIGKWVGGAGMLAGAGMMLTPMLGSAGDKMAPVMMGAGAGMMFGPYGAAAGAALGGGFQIFQSLKQQSDNAGNALKMSSISADMFGESLKTIADAQVEDFIKSMTDNSEATRSATDAVGKFTDAIRNAPEGSPERSTIDRLKDLSGSNSWWEGLFKSARTGLGAWFNEDSPIGGMNPYDVNPQEAIKGELKQKYTTALISGSDSEEALAQVVTYAREGNVAYILSTITEELKNIKTESAAVAALAGQLDALKRNGKDTKEMFRDVFNPSVVMQLSRQEIPALSAAISNAGMTWETYMQSMAEGNSDQEMFASQIAELATLMRVDTATAIEVVIAKLNDLPVDYNNFIGRSRGSILAILDGMQKESDLTDSAREKIDDYFQKNPEKSKSGGSKAVDIEAAQEASQARVEAAQEASEKEIKAIEDAAKERQKAMQDEIEALQKRYDDEIEALQKVEDKRKENYDKEQTRLQRQKDERASEIDYLRAMSEGRFYDAAAIKNDMEAQRGEWDAEDSEAAKSKKAEEKIAGLTEERDGKVEKMQNALEKQVEFDQKALEKKREHDQEMLKQLQDSEADRLKEIQNTNSKISKSNKKTGENSKQVVNEILNSAKRGSAALQKTLDKYTLTQDEAMALLVRKAGMSGADAARALGGSLKDADWKSLAKGIEAKLNGDNGVSDNSAGKYFEAFWNSIGDSKFGVSGSGQASALGYSTANNIPSGRGNPPAMGPQSPPAMRPQYRAYGGYIAGSGTATSDSIPARLSNGEYVIKAASVKKVGVARLNKLNQTGDVANFAEGGLAGSVVRTATWDYIQSRIDAKVEAAKEFLADNKTITAADYVKYSKDIGNMAKVVSHQTNNNGRYYTGGGPHSVGWRNTPHWGVNDIGGAGMEVRAYARGKILHAGPFSNGSYSPGSTVDIVHSNGGKTRYAHLQSFRVKAGDSVSAGEKIGTSGSDHLHFEWTGMPSLTQRESGGKVPWLKKGGLIKKVKEGYNGSVISLPFVGQVSGFTNTQLNELVDIYSTLSNSKARTSPADQSGVSNRIAPMKNRTPGAAKAFAKEFMMSKYNWGAAEFSALDKLWMKESGWNWAADNPTSDAYGIPQSLPGSKMASAGSDWKTNPETQIKWGLGYIRGRYGSPTSAWNHSVANNWYRDGGMVVPQLRKGAFVKYDNTLANLHKGETVLTAPLTKKLKDNVASSTNSVYHISMQIDQVNGIDEFESAVFTVMDKANRRVGRK